MSTEQTLNPQNKFLSWFSPPAVLPDSVGVRRVSDPVSITCLPPLTQRTFIIPQASAIHQHWAEQWGHRGDIFLVPALEEYTEMAGGSESKYSNMPGPEHSISRYPKSILTSCQPVLCVAAAVSLSQAPSKKEPPVPPAPHPFPHPAVLYFCPQHLSISSTLCLSLLFLWCVGPHCDVNLCGEGLREGQEFYVLCLLL